MLKELKIFGIVAAFTLVLYWGVEPFAHSQMHKHVDYLDLIYDGKADIAEAEAKYVAAKDTNMTAEKIAAAEATVKNKKEFWKGVADIAKLQGNIEAGAGGFAMCGGCHLEGGPNMNGVIPPPLHNAGVIYTKEYLIALIKDPAMAMNTDHKFADTSMHPMGSIKGMFADNQSIADTVAYIMDTTKTYKESMEKKAAEETKAKVAKLAEVGEELSADDIKEMHALKLSEITSKDAYMQACARCHANRYGKITQLGDIPKFKSEKDTLAYKIKIIEEQDLVKEYMGKIPPDLSIIIRARGHHFLETFIENPQSQLAGTAMPRVGLSKAGMDSVMHYLQMTGDPSKPAREELGPKVLLFFLIFTILAYLWKKAMWKGHY